MPGMSAILSAGTGVYPSILGPPVTGSRTGAYRLTRLAGRWVRTANPPSYLLPGAQTNLYERFVHPSYKEPLSMSLLLRSESPGRSSGTTSYVDDLRRLGSALAQKRSPLVARVVARRKAKG